MILFGDGPRMAAPELGDQRLGLVAQQDGAQPAGTPRHDECAEAAAAGREPDGAGRVRGVVPGIGGVTVGVRRMGRHVRSFRIEVF
jgi:hypothetical protein